MSNKTLQELTLALPSEKVVKFLLKTANHHDPEKFMDCALCCKDDWQLRSSPDDVSKAILVAQPIPNSKNFACWYFPISCKNCGYTIYFDAQTVAEKLNQKEEIE
ncbi:hypothetical protein [Yersinia frederiksenii]|uniref:hypothetical protein n=1 Tax=Yersinia frederiksenii TaxID=29484 RepID=UPI000BFBEFBE|nr:hypothetical protein [Yersinia frederiksenii]ATM86715.1 hypothetical protein CRN74_11860 [Yersinia frederiksenii]